MGSRGPSLGEDAGYRDLEILVLPPVIEGVRRAVENTHHLHSIEREWARGEVERTGAQPSALGSFDLLHLVAITLFFPAVRRLAIAVDMSSPWPATRCSACRNPPGRGCLRKSN